MADPTKARPAKPAKPADDEPTPAPAPTVDPEIAAARDAELKRQQDVIDAVAKANRDELPKLGGSNA